MYVSHTGGMSNPAIVTQLGVVAPGERRANDTPPPISDSIVIIQL